MRVFKATSSGWACIRSIILIKVGFWYDYGIAYSGGLNYFRNLLYAISLNKSKNIDPYVFFGTDVDEQIVEGFRPFATVIQTPVLTRKTFPWFIHRTLFRLLNSQYLVNATLSRYGISIVSHGSMVYCTRKPRKLISWIADFQYLHLPTFFPDLDIRKKTEQLNKLINASDIVVLSSYDALNDFNKIVKVELASKARVLQFVSQPNETFLSKNKSVNREYLENKFGFRGRYFFLPNQFWEHKNHQVVFDAVRILKEKGKEILVICTGSLCDHGIEKSKCASKSIDFINENHLDTNIKILGLIDYADVLSFFRYSIAVINPSLFEGWSSSVEEAKSIGTRVILSNINVHIEQNPKEGIFFNPYESLELSKILENAWDAWPDNVSAVDERAAREQLHARTLEFGKKYLEIIDELDVDNNNYIEKN